MKKKRNTFNDLLKEHDCTLEEAKELFSMLQFLRIKTCLTPPVINYGNTYTLIPVGDASRT